MITLTKIAKLANVSVSTASKAFSGNSEVNEETRELIFSIAKQHHCFKKYYNVKYPKLVIALIAPEFKSTYYTQYLTYIQETFNKGNCELCVSATNFSAQKEKELLEYYYKHSDVDAIIVINAQTDVTEHFEIPVLFINPKIQSSFAVSVCNDMEPALNSAIDHLISHNLNKIGFIGEKLTEGKFNLFKSLLSKKNVDLDDSFFCITEKRFEEGGYCAMQSLLKNENLPNAIVCAYDSMAFGAMRCIFDHGLSVPNDILILGMDDLPESKYFNPPLASISSRIDEVCCKVADIVLRSINGEPVENKNIIKASFVLRRSFNRP